MTATTELTVGQTVRGVEELDALPVGTRLECTRNTPPHYAIKRETNWEYGGGNYSVRQARDTEELSRGHQLHGFVIRELPEIPVEPVPLNVTNIANYPVGTTVGWQDGTTFVKTSNDRWERREVGSAGFPTTRTDERWEGTEGWVVTEMPVETPAYTGPQVGDVPGTRYRLNQLPVGSIICDRERLGEPADQHYSTWRRSPEGWVIWHGGQARDVLAVATALQEENLARWTVHTVGSQPGGTQVPTPTLTQMGRLTWEQFDNLPVGSVVRDQNGNGTRLTKLADGEWEHQRNGSGFRRTLEGMLGSGAVRFWSYPRPQLNTITGEITVAPVAPAYPAVGEGLTERAQFDALPVGSVVSAGRNRYYYVKTSAARWHHAEAAAPHAATRERFGGDWTLGGHNTVVRIGPEPLVHPYRVGQEAGVNHPDEETFALLPVGTRMEYAGDEYTKEARGWHREATYERDSWWSDPGTITFLPGVPVPGPTPVITETVEAAVAQVKAEVRECINTCVSNQGSWRWVADGAFILLGIDPVPELESTISVGAAFGLPVGSVIRHQGGLYQVSSNSQKMPQFLHGINANPHYAHDCRIVLLGERTEPVYTGRNNFLHTLWDKERELRSRYDWCAAVEGCLEDAGLEDPGNVPDVVTTTAPPEPHRELQVGDILGGDDLTTEAEVALLRALPVGSTVFVGLGGPGTCIRTDTTPLGWVGASDLDPYDMTERQEVRVTHIAETVVGPF